MMNSPTASTDVLSFIRANCKQLLGSKFWQIRFCCKVDAGWKSEKLESKYMVLSKFRLFLVSGKTASKLQVEGSYNVLSIGEINCTRDYELLLGLDGRKLHLRLTESGLNAMDVATKLLQAFKNYFPSCDPMRFMHLEPSSLYALFAVLPRSRPSLSCDGFRRTYAALCDFYKLPFRDEVVWDIEKIYALQSSSILRLDDFSHLFPKDLIPVVAALQFTSWFNGISAETFKLASEVVEVIILVVRKSQHLKSLSLRYCGLKSDFLQQLASALHANQTIPLDSIDFSGNVFDEGKAVVQFASSLSSLNTGFRCVILSDCCLHSKSVNAVCTALQQNQKRVGAKTLGLISFAKNTLKSDAAELYHLLSSTSLETLDISGTGISLEGVLNSMKASNDRISSLIVSGCSFPERKGKDLASSNTVKDFFANAVALTSIDLSDCALTSDVLKFVLLGIVCNQKVTSLRLNLTNSFADRQCISMLETCAPNLVSVSDLVLRDLNLEQDALPLIRSFPLMPNLRRLDIGGNNFNGIRKQQPKLLVNIMLELAKLINDEEGPLRELVLSDCHLGVNLSVLLNALGVAPTLLSLDISGNDVGNAGARLLAKALQLNAVLDTLYIDKNQISYDGYMDILHALKGNNTVRRIPYPLHDACESLKYNREKIETALAEIEKLLQRNSNKWSPKDSVLSTEGHSRLMLTNTDDEINKAVYSAEHLLVECKWKDTSNPDVTRLRTLLDDAEKAKKLLDEMTMVANRSEFIDDFVQQFVNQYVSKYEEKMKACGMQLSDIIGNKEISIFTDKDIPSVLRDSSSHKARAFSSSLHPMFDEFQEKLRHHFKQAAFAMACGAVEKVEQELLRSLLTANRNVDGTQTSISISECGPPSGQSMTSSSGTPKGKRKKFRLFARSTRPKSIIESDGIMDNTDDTMEEAALVTPMDSCGNSLDSESFEVVDKPASANDENDEVPKLTHLVKDRPRLPYNRRQRATMMGNEKQAKEGLDYAAGMDNFFAPRKESDQEMKKEDQERADVSKRVSRLPPNAVPLISAELLQERGNVGKALTPRAAPSPPPSAVKPAEGVDQSTSIHLPVINEDASVKPKRLSVGEAVLSHGNEKAHTGHVTNNAKVLPPSPVIKAKVPAPPPPVDTHSDARSPVQDSPVSSPSQETPTPRSDNDSGPNRSEITKLSISVEENNNAAAEATSVAASSAKTSLTPPPRPPPPPSSKLMKTRQPEPVENTELNEPLLRNKPIDAAASHSQSAAQRKSVLDLTAMFESKPPPPTSARPVPPPRPNKKSPV